MSKKKRTQHQTLEDFLAPITPLGPPSLAQASNPSEKANNTIVVEKSLANKSLSEGTITHLQITDLETAQDLACNLKVSNSSRVAINKNVLDGLQLMLSKHQKGAKLLDIAGLLLIKALRPDIFEFIQKQ